MNFATSNWQHRADRARANDFMGQSSHTTNGNAHPQRMKKPEVGHGKLNLGLRCDKDQPHRWATLGHSSPV
ncbi:MAG: hypothetical protein CMJ77_05715 [Planctomycetaceae bacterium]|nr:hypothetical protein [Planctomycetaceae bacterium]